MITDQPAKTKHMVGKQFEKVILKPISSAGLKNNRDPRYTRHRYNIFHDKIPEGTEHKAVSLTYKTLQSPQPSYLRQLFTIQPSRSTRSSSALTLLRPTVTSSLKFAERSID